MTSKTLLWCLLLLLAKVSSLGATPLAGAGHYTNRLIVKFSAPTQATGRSVTLTDRVAALGTRLGLSIHAKRKTFGGLSVVSLQESLHPDQVQAIAAAIAADPEVLYAEPDYRRFPADFRPADALYSQQWHLWSPSQEPAGIDAESAWQITTGAENAVVVAVLDSGVTDHPDLIGQLADDGDGPPGYDFVSLDIVKDDQDNSTEVPATANDGNGRDGDPADPGDWINEEVKAAYPDLFANCDLEDSTWHGASVTSIIAARQDDDPISGGIVGVSFNARVLPVRVLGRCGGYISDITDGIRWAAGLSVPGVPDNLSPAKVLNLSFGGVGPCSQSEQDAINAVVTRGVVVVAAAGNESGTPSAPGNCDNVITVGAATRQGGRTFYTNFGEQVDISAPGGNTPSFRNGILAATDTGTEEPLSSNYQERVGTSFATPLVSGAAALLLSHRPELLPNDVEFILQNTARSFPVSTTDSAADCTLDLCGAGLIDLRAALASPLSGAPPTTSDTGAAPSSSGGGGSLTLLAVAMLAAMGAPRHRLRRP